MYQESKEGIPHFANKAVVWKLLHTKLREGKSFYLFCRHQGNDLQVNVMDGVTEVVQEGEFGWANHAPYRADVLLRRGNEPPVAIEIIRTSEPSESKIRDAAQKGIDLYEIEGRYRPFSDQGLKVLRAHIAPRNRKAHERFTQRMIDLYGQIANPQSLDDGFIRVVKNWRGSLDQHDQARLDEWAEFSKKFADLRNEIRQQHVFCLRCEKPLQPFEGGKGFSYSSMAVHRPSGGCGSVHLCQACEFAIRGGWDEVFPDDAMEWLPRDDCAACQRVHTEHAEELLRKYGPGPVGYVVNGRTVSREEFLGLMALLKWVAVETSACLARKNVSAQHIREFHRMTEEEITRMQEAVYSGSEDINDVSLRPATAYGGALPPCLLSLVTTRE